MLLLLLMIVQVLCEVLPISSSGHVRLFISLAEQFGYLFEQGDLFWAFDYFLQAVSAIIFLIFFFRQWFVLTTNHAVSMYAFLESSVWKEIGKVLVFGIIVDGITTLLWLGGIADVALPLTVGFVITASLLFFLQYVSDKSVKLWQWQHAVFLGLVQGLSLLPGISRFASTFTALRVCGYSNPNAMAVSFLVQWPLIVAGSLKGLLALRGNEMLLEQIVTPTFMIGMLIAGIVSYFILSWVQSVVQKNKLWKFSWYMVVPIVVSGIIG